MNINIKKYFDIIVIGAGPAGYTASIKASQLGVKVACIDNWKDEKNNPALGGTCANVGCIPSKALLKFSEDYKNAIYNFKNYGIIINNIKLDLNIMQKKKNTIIKQINNGIKYLFTKNKITFFHGKAIFLKKKKKYIINIINKNKNIKITGKYIIIATGSKPKKINNISFDEKIILSNIGGLSSIKKKTKKLCIIGAGAIGLEIGSIWNRLNLNITILEQSPFFLNKIDKEISQKILQILTKQKLKINLNTKIYKIKNNKNNVLIKYSSNLTNKIKKKIFDKVMICIGREPNTKKLNIKNINLLTDKKGFIKVNNKFETNLKNIWAIGDVIGGDMLAHKAEEEALHVVNYIFKKNIKYKKKKLIPFVIYTSPEIAWAGKTEEQLINKKINYKKGIFPFLANAKAKILDNNDGIIKILVEKNTKKILGIHIIGPSASELIGIVITAMQLNATYNDISKICYAHPSLSEVIKEVMFSINKKSINF